MKPKQKSTKETLIEQIALQKELTRRDCLNSFYNFFQYFWSAIIPEPMLDNWHIKYLCAELQIVGERLIKREPALYDLVINVPPGTTKSTIVTIMFPVWLWIRDPTLRTISGSYSAEIAIDHAVRSRNIINSYKFQELFGDLIQFAPDQNNKSYYQNMKGGTRSACGVGGAVTGKHGHLLQIDDPINPKQAASEQYRKVANEWMDKTFSTRKIDKAVSVVIIIMQRLHEEDPSGYRLAKGNVKHICLPAEITDLENVFPEELEKHYVDGLLDPVRMTPDVLAWEKEQMGSMEYAGQYLQSPMAAEGNILKRDWFPVKQLPESKPVRIIQSWDTAFKDKESNDFNACTTWYEFPDMLYIVHALNEKLNYPELKRRFVSHTSAWFPHVILIPDTDAGQALIMDMMAESKYPITPIKVDRDKVSNAKTASPLAEAGKVSIVSEEPWENILLNQLCGFPNVKNDDLVDTVTQLLNWIRENPFGVPFGVGRKRDRSQNITRGYNYAPAKF
jgi:predicted phage terminase large subunit-like protein